MIWSIMSGSLIRATPPWARMSAGTRSSAMTAAAPASSAIFACSGVTTSMMTPPLSISARPALTRNVPVSICEVRIPADCRGGPGREPLADLLWARPAGGVTRGAAAHVDHAPVEPQELRDLAPDPRLGLDHEVVR